MIAVARDSRSRGAGDDEMLVNTSRVEMLGSDETLDNTRAGRDDDGMNRDDDGMNHTTREMIA